MADEVPNGMVKRTNELMAAWAFRALIGLLAVVGVPIMVNVLDSLSKKADDVVDAVHKHDTALELLKFGNQEISTKLTEFRKDLQDQDQRLRTLERGASPPDPRPR